MRSNKKQLFLGVALGTLGLSLYNSIKDSRERFKYMAKKNLNHSTNSANLSEKSTENDDIINGFKELKEQANLLQNRLNELKN